MAKKLQLLVILLISSLTALQAQQVQSGRRAIPVFPSSEKTAATVSNTNGDRVSMVTCSDKVNYVGNIYGQPEQCGGLFTYQPYLYFQTFPNYNGQVTRVDVRAVKLVSNVNAQVLVYAINSNGEPTGSPLGTANVTITAGWNDYGANFSPPVTVSGGFAAAVFAPLVADSFLVACAPDNSQMYGNNAYAYDDGNGFVHPVYGDKDLIFRPTISFTMPTATLSATPSSACVGDFFTFTGGSGTLPVHFNDDMYNTTPNDSYIDFGDGSPTSSGGWGYHAYSTGGTKTATYTILYTGWNSTCTASHTQNVTVNPAATSSFSYGTTNLLLTVVNASTNATGYSWNFGDLTTSNLQNPPTHDYGLTQGAGTYVVELTTTGACGNGYQAKTVTVAPGTSTGINETSFDESIFIYPNPAAENITVSYELATTGDAVNMFVADVSGRILKTKTLNDLYSGSVSFDIRDLASGIYFIRLSSDQRTTTRKFVKQ
ncbi:MAG TPA: T9SS type A sorting domain-containing protein [Bacteroidia bacterium]|nr:T9SS type A sorting domain-containing protein [Bacteroidia bacterium]